MKIFRLTAALFFLALPAFSQGITVAYDIINRKTAPEAPALKSVLTDNGPLSKFFVHIPPEFSKDQPKEGLVKDKRAAVYYTADRLFQTRFDVVDSLHRMRWQLTGKSQTILGYPCLSATTTFRGRAYTAYYAPKLAIANGPWKLGGLPGLILAAKTDDGFQEWRATNVTLGPVPPLDADLAAVKARKNINWNTFVAKYKEVVLRRNKYLRSQGNTPDDTELKVLIGSLEIFYPELQTGKGLSY